MFAKRWHAIRSKTKGAFALPFIFALFVAQYFAAGPLNNWIVDYASGGTTHNWQSHLSAELRSVEETGEYTRLLATIRTGLMANQLQQVDVFNEQCQCAVSMKAFPLSQRQANAKILEGIIKGSLPNQQTFEIGNNHATFDFDRPHQDSNHDASGMFEHDGHTHLISNVFHVDLASGQSIGIRLHLNISHAAEVQSFLFVGLGFAFTVLLAIVLYAAERFTRRSQTAERMSLERAQYLAEHDPLTGFLNRYGFHKETQQCLERCEETGVRGFLIVYDADHFKEVNDQHGHDTGDAVLVEMANLLRESYPKDAIFGRLGGDEFAVFARSASQWKNVDNFIATRKTTLALSLPHAGRDLEGSVSAGYAQYPDHATTYSDLMKAADLALLNVKREAKSTIGLYRPEMKERFERRIWEIQGIRTATETDGIVPYYQPIVSSHSGKICLFEALARWKHPSEGMLAPGAFQNALEDPAVSQLLTGVMLDRVTRDLKTSWDRGHKIPVALNLGQADLKQVELPDLLSAALDRYELPPTALMVEVTESAVAASNMSNVLHVLNDIRKRDIEISLDDFGTGASSITLLRVLPCTKLKIDKSFVDNVVHDCDDNAIVRALTRMGHDLNMNVVVEGVEDREQEAILRAIGAEYLQGYLYSAPVPFDQVSDLLRKHGSEELLRTKEHTEKVAS